MKLVPTRPVTIASVQHGQRWFPYLFRHTDGSLLLYLHHGFDKHFSTIHRSRSLDGGRTWTEERENTPCVVWCHSFADGELFEIDFYGHLDPRAKHSYVYYGAWSFPAEPRRAVVQGKVRVHSPSAIPNTLSEWSRGGYPTFPWWALYNELHGKSEVSGDEVIMGGPFFTSGVEVDGRLIALGYVALRAGDGNAWRALCFESKDRGRNWEEISAVAAEENGDESSLVVLRDGRLYAVLRTAGVFHHAWSSDAGKTWTKPEPIHLVDSDHQPSVAWPVCKVLADGTLVMVYGRPGKYMIFDPSGTGRQWQGRLDLHAWELDAQAMFGVPPELRLHGPTQLGVRYWDSSDYLGCVPVGPREMLVCYDVQNYHEHWNALPVSAVRLVRVRLE